MHYPEIVYTFDTKKTLNEYTLSHQISNGPKPISADHPPSKYIRNRKKKNLLGWILERKQVI